MTVGNRGTLAAYVLTALLCGGAGLYVFDHNTRRNKPALELSPATYVVSRNPVAGETVIVDVRVNNVCGKPVSVVGVVTSCGCSSVGLSGVTDLSDDNPYVIDQPYGILKIRTNTRTKGGATHFTYALRYIHPRTQQEHVINGRIHMSVGRGLATTPSRVEFAAPLADRVRHVDVLTDVTGLGLERCVVSDEDVLSVTYVASRSETNPRSLDNWSIGRLRIECSPTISPGRYWVRLYPTVSDALPREIPVAVRAADTIRAYPKELVLIDTNPRIVSLVRLGGWDEEPTIESPSRYCNVVIERGSESAERIARLTFTEECKGHAFTVTVRHPSGDRVAIPVSVLAQ